MKMFKIDMDDDLYDETLPKKKKSGWIKKLLAWSLAMGFLLLVIGGFGALMVLERITQDLPDLRSLGDYRPPIITTVYSDDGRKIAEYCRERRIIIPIEEMPDMLIKAFVATEDSRFFQHPGVDLIGIGRAFLKNLEAGDIKEGASTITQQVTRTFLLSREKTYTRKLKEAILAYRIDKVFSKHDVLYLYLNQIFLGHGAYGVEAAAQTYFGKKAKELTLAECAMLAGLPKSPAKYSPYKNFDKAKERQAHVLRRMTDEGYITPEEAKEALNFPITIQSMPANIEDAPYYAEHVRRYIEKKFGEDMLYTKGLQIYTAVNLNAQKMAQEELEKGLRELDKRQGYRGPKEQIKPADTDAFLAKLQAEVDKNPIAEGKIVTGLVSEVDDRGGKVTVRIGNAKGVIPFDDMRWARKPNFDVEFEGYNGARRPGEVLRKGDVIDVRVTGKVGTTDVWKLSLEQTPLVEGAILCIEAGTGLVKAMIGGRDHSKSQFNRAIQSRRQPGSAFKGLIYAAAIDCEKKKYTPATIIEDTPIVYNDGTSKLWKPQNYDRKFYGPIPVREALAKSRNIPSIRVLDSIGVDYFINYARKLGITSELHPDLSLALGSSGVSVLELVRAYSVFANKGELIEPIFVTKIVDRDGDIIEQNIAKPKRVIDESSAYIMTNLLESVVKNGTGRKVKALNRPVAGKTGTTNNLFDAWFVGYTPEYITGVWVGFDEERSIGAKETGGKAASPIWLGFMQRMLEGKPVMDFEAPKSVVFAKINENTYECFKEGTVPVARSEQPIVDIDPDTDPEVITDREEFFKSDM